MSNISWIIGKREDLLWFIGSVIMSYIFLSIYYGLNYFTNASFAVSSLVIYLLWTILFDATHIFATYTRTYFDKDFRQRNARLIYGGLALLLIGPLYMMLFYYIGTQEQYRAAFLVFNRFGLLYAYYHLIRQHWGFIALYNKKNGTASPTQIKLESIVLWSGTIYPLIYHHIHYYLPVSLAEKLSSAISFNDWIFICKVFLFIFVVLRLFYFIFKDNSLKIISLYISNIFLISPIVIFITIYFRIDQCLTVLLLSSAIVFALSLTSYLGYLVNNRDKLRSALPKLLVLSLVLFTNNFILSLKMPYITAFACMTVFHNIQYHAIIRFHNKNKYLNNESKFGLASVLTKNILMFAFLALSFNLVFTIPRTIIENINIHEFLIYFSTTIIWGVAFHHYVLDAIIWRPSRDSDVKLNLNLTNNGQDLVVVK